MRSKLFVPGSRPDLFEKARASDADALSFDLEDAVVDSRKVEACQAVQQFLGSPSSLSSDKRMVVRVNPWGSDHCERDLEAIAGLPIAMVNLPKCESAADVRASIALLEKFEARGRASQRPGVLANVETAAGLRAAAAIASCHPRVVGLQVGYLDLLGPLGIARNDPANVHAVMFAVRMAAGEAGIAAYDGAFADLQDAVGFREEAEMARRLGFAGKSCIHPSQIATANDVFGADAAEIKQARRIIEAARSAARDGQGAVVVDGEMVDRATLRRAEALLARAGSTKVAVE